MKKILSLGLVLVMVLGMGVMPAFAAEGDATETETTTPNYVYYDSDIPGTWANGSVSNGRKESGQSEAEIFSALGGFRGWSNWSGMSITGVPETESEYASAEKILNFNSANTGSSASYYKILGSALSATADYSPTYYKVTLDFKLDPERGENIAKVRGGIWENLEVVSGAGLKTLGETYNIADSCENAVEALNNTDLVLYWSNRGFNMTESQWSTLYPIAVIGTITDSNYTKIEYIYSVSGTSTKTLKVEAIKIGDSYVSTLLDDVTTVNSLKTTSSNSELIFDNITNSTSEYSVIAVPQDKSSSKGTTLSYRKIKFEGLTELPIEIPEVTSTNFDNVKSTGNVSITFNMPVDPTTVSLALKEQGTNADTWYSRKMPTSYEYDEDTNTYSVSFEETPLHTMGTYQLTLKAGTAGTQAMTGETAEDIVVGTFEATDDKYYVNENFDLYNNSTNMHNSASDAYGIWTASISGGYQNVVNAITDGMMHAQLKTTTETAQSVYFKYRSSKMPVVDKTETDVKTVELRFKFSNLPQGGYIDVYSQILSIYRDSTDGKTYLYAERSTGGDIKIAPVPENEDVVMTINYSANDLTNRYNRKFYNIKINDTLYTTTADGTALSSLAITSQGFDCGIEMEKGSSFNLAMFSLNKPASTGALTTASDLWVYEVKYSMYEKPAGEPDYDVSINKFSSGQIQVKAIEIAGKGASESVIVAAYDAALNKLLDVKVVPVNLPKLGDMKETFTLDTGDATNVKYRKFRFGSIAGLDPISGTADTTLE